MAQPTIAQKEPYMVEIKAGRKYFWCACGLSSKQPFCDGSHKETEFEPVVWQAEVDGKKFFCGCKQTGKKPFCDGYHKKL